MSASVTPQSVLDRADSLRRQLGETVRDDMVASL